jgi:hypothetical protein
MIFIYLILISFYILVRRGTEQAACKKGTDIGEKDVAGLGGWHLLWHYFSSTICR